MTFSQVAFWGLLSHGATLVLLLFLVRFLDATIVQGAAWQARWHDLAGFLMGLLVGQGARLRYLRKAAQLGMDATAKLRTSFWTRLLAEPVLPSRDAGDTMQEGPARVLKVADALEPWYSQFLPQAFLAVAVPSLIFCLVLYLDPLTALVLGVTGPLLPLFLALIGIRAKQRAERQWKTHARLRFLFLESLAGLKTLKIFGLGRQRKEELMQADVDFREQTLRVLRTAFLSALALEWTATLGTALVAVEVALRLLNGRLDFFVGLLVLLWTPEFYKPIRQVGLGFHASLDARTAYKDNPHLFNTLGPSKNDMNPEVLQGNICGAELCITTPHGTTYQVAPRFPALLTGPSGTGKTCFILGYLGHFSAKSTQTSLLPLLGWEHIGWLPQHPVLLAGPLWDNLCPRGRKPREQVLEALDKVGLSNFIHKLEGNLETPVQENGRNFSGGERRRLALARLLLLDRPVWILDEPLAGLDSRAAMDVLDWLERESAHRTVIHITHHRQSLQRAQRIFFMQDGEITAVGSHEELLAKNVAYRATVSAAEGTP